MKQDALDALNSGLQEGQDGRSVKRYLRMCLYGAPGTGKTTLATRICEVLGGPTLLLFTDSTWVAIDKPPAVNKDITPVPYAGFSQLEVFAEARNEGIQPWAGFRNLIVDAIGGGVDDSRRELTKRRKFNDQRDPEISSWSHYNLIGDKFADAMKTLRSTDLNIIYIAHLREPNEADREKKRFAIRPDLPYATFLKLSREAALVGWTHKEKHGSERLIQTEGTLNEEAKSQIVTIPEGIHRQNDIPEMIKQWKEMTENV